MADGEPHPGATEFAFSPREDIPGKDICVAVWTPKTYTFGKRIFAMKFQVPVSKLFLLALHKNYDKLREAGIDIAVLLSIDGAEEGADEEGQKVVKIKPDEKLIEALESLIPFTTVLMEMRGDSEKLEYEDVRVHFHECETVSVACPFCGFEQEYAVCVAPHAFPRQCKCGATVSLDIGDRADVFESVSHE